MKKDFDNWNINKKIIDETPREIDFHEREIWWCSIGINIGHEQLSQSDDFSRPVLILKKFTEDIFWGIPITTKIKNASYRLTFKLKNIDNQFLILQTRAYDRKRLIRKIITIQKQDFNKITDYIKSLL